MHKSVINFAPTMFTLYTFFLTPSLMNINVFAHYIRTHTSILVPMTLSNITSWKFKM